MSSDDVTGEDFTGWTLEKPGDPMISSSDGISSQILKIG
jgi:hypothetical protein